MESTKRSLSPTACNPTTSDLADTGIIFVVSMSGYDQFLFEDQSQNRLQESLRVFADLNRDSVKIMQHASVIIFLNKMDLFEEKIKHIPLTTCFPNYQGPNTAKDAIDHIKGKFLSKNHDQTRKIYVHETCATNTDQMSHIFDAVNHTIINKALVKAGLLVGP